MAAHKALCKLVILWNFILHAAVNTHSYRTVSLVFLSRKSSFFRYRITMCIHRRRALPRSDFTQDLANKIKLVTLYIYDDALKYKFVYFCVSLFKIHSTYATTFEGSPLKLYYLYDMSQQRIVIPLVVQVLGIAYRGHTLHHFK